MATWGRIRGYSRSVKLAKNRWQGAVGYWCQTSATRALEETLYGTTLPGYSGTHAPVCTRVESLWNRLGPDVSLVVAQFETLRVSGKATLKVSPRSQQHVRYKDGLGNIIVGPDEDGIHEWKVVHGSNVIVEHYARFLCETAYWPGQLTNLKDRLGDVANNPMDKFLGAQAFELRLAGARVWQKSPTDLIYVDYIFDWLKGGWPNWLETQKSVWTVRRLPVFELDGTTLATDENDNYLSRDVLILTPAQKENNSVGNITYSDEQPEHRLVYSFDNFSDINNMVEW